MRKSINKKEAEEIISKSLSVLGLSENIKTNPLIMKEVINEMKLDDFESTANIFDLQEIQTKEKEFRPLFVDIKKALINNNPAIIEFLELALKKGWLKKSENIVKSAHILYIFEFLTSAICNNDVFFDEIHTHIKLKEKEYGLDLSNAIKALFNLYHLSHTFFGSVKALTVDPMMIHINPRFRDFKLSKKELKTCYKNHRLNYFEYKLLKRKNKIKSFLELGKINIYEAGITDYNKGFKSNALCAEALSEELNNLNTNIKYRTMLIAPANSKNTFYKQLSENYSIDFPVSQNWQSLYVSWNLVFVLGHLDNLDILFPKLLIPSVLGVKSNQFIEARVVSLWLSIIFYIFRLEENKTLSGPKDRFVMAQEFGEINKKYAIELANKDLHENEKEFIKLYNQFFSHRYLNFFKILKNFF
tara:strand:- start:621 stop:1868 length:1248 start_codon:yes stop_codon:yes gene_type:complete